MNRIISTCIRHQRGFTLIEIMIALLLLALIMTSLFGGLYTANKHWQIGQEKINTNEEIRLADRVIRQYVASAMPIVKISNTERQLLFDGKVNSLSFVAQLPAHRGGGGFYLVTLATQTNQKSKELGLYYRSIYQADNGNRLRPDQQGNYVTLIDNIDSVIFSYYGHEDINEDAVWQDSWNSNNRLPEMVRIELISTDENKLWPVLDIPFRINFVGNYPEFLMKETS